MQLNAVHTIIENQILIPIILTAITLLLTASFYMLIIILYKRKQKIKKEILKKRYQEIIDQSLFRFLFQNTTQSIMPEKVGSGRFSSSALFQKVAIKSLVTLHQNYSGEYKEKLELYYTQSGLVQYSLSKLASPKLAQKVEGIRDLSNLRYRPSINKIREYIRHPNEMVQVEALGGIVKMTGLEELVSLCADVYLNDWVQSNIMFQVKSAHVSEPANLGDMLQSRNASLQLLAVRLADHFNSAKYTESLQALRNAALDIKLRNEIDATLSRLQSFYKSVL